jgi:superoxide dismutase, Fe-Mn family
MLELTKLPYSYNQLEPYLDAKTIEIHYSKHHKTYLDNLNKLIEANPALQSKSLSQIMSSVNSLPVELQRPVINNAGQVYNHDLYWKSLSKHIDQKPSGLLADKINSQYGSYAEFMKLWKEAGLTQFGSGWVFLTVKVDKSLEIVKTSNADNPMFRGVESLMTMDVWEHAYYIGYQNKRGDYIDAYFRILNWEEISQKYSESVK